MAADARLCALTHFDFDGGTGLQIILVNAKPAGGHLNDGMAAKAVEILVQSALACVIADAKLFCGARKA